MRSMRPFVYDQSAIRVIFGVGVLDRLAEEVQRLPAKRALVLTTPGQSRLAEDAAGGLRKQAAGVYTHAGMHVSHETAPAARAEAERLAAGWCVAVGGGATLWPSQTIVPEVGL